jgi:hypothetical protein
MSRSLEKVTGARMTFPFGGEACEGGVETRSDSAGAAIARLVLMAAAAALVGCARPPKTMTDSGNDGAGTTGSGSTGPGGAPGASGVTGSTGAGGATGGAAGSTGEGGAPSSTSAAGAAALARQNGGSFLCL